MKKAFTMIELIFVIVILGILAAVAIPKLTNIKHNAEITTAQRSLSVIFSDIFNNDAFSYLTNTKIAKWSDLTNSPSTISISGKPCVIFNTQNIQNLSFATTKNEECLEFYKNSNILLQNDKSTPTHFNASHDLNANPKECKFLRDKDTKTYTTAFICE